MSTFLQAVDEYLRLRRSLGFKLRDEGDDLPQFARFIEQQGAAFITTDLAVQWATQPQGTSPAYCARRLGMVRLFAQHHAATDSRTEIPPQGLLPYRYRRKQPYIYASEQILKLLGAAKQLQSPNGLRALTYSTMFGLLAVTGMRMRESTALDRQDVDLDHGELTIRGTKFGKSRLVPVHESTRQKLDHYRSTCTRLFPRPVTDAFFLSDRGTRLTPYSVRWTFVRLSRLTGLRGPYDSHGPRLHDLRHSFAVTTLLQWYRSGQDVNQRLPELATYLGHAHVNDTYWYLTAVPELLQLAARRLDFPQEDIPHEGM